MAFLYSLNSPVTQTTPFLRTSKAPLLDHLPYFTETRSEKNSYILLPILLPSSCYWGWTGKAPKPPLVYKIPTPQGLKDTVIAILPLSSAYLPPHRTIPLPDRCCNFSKFKTSQLHTPSSYCLTSLLPFRAKPLESTVWTWCFFLSFHFL